MLNNQKRNQTIDITKGLGIILVVVGHSWFSTNKEVATMIFSFHMPLFFFISGVFSKSNISGKDLVNQKFHSLLKSYFSVLIIVGIIYITFKDYNIYEYIYNVLYGSSSTIPWGPLWFLPHLFLIFIFSYYFSKLLSFEKKTYTFKYLAILLILIFGYLSKDFLWLNNFNFMGKSLKDLPFNLDIIFLTTPYFILGYLLKNKIINFKINYIYLIISLIVFISLHYIFDFTIDFNNRRYDNLIVNTILALSGIYITFSMSKVFLDLKYLVRFLSYLGTTSLFIFIFHVSFLNKTYSILINYYPDFYLLFRVIDIIVAITIPLIIYELVKNTFLSKFFLYQKRI